MAKDPHRHRRVESEIQRVVSELLLKEVSDPRVGRITITAVNVSPDLGHATLFYTVFGKSRNGEELDAGLASAARFMRGQVGRALKLRVAPELHFKADVQLMEGLRLGELISSAVTSDRQRHVADDDSEQPQHDSRPADAAAANDDVAEKD